jgi:predicted metal-binding membrane protein
VFGAGVVATAYLHGSAAGGMPMGGGSSIGAPGMQLPGRAWLASAGGFTGMWVVMMVAMMMPALVPMLSSYRRLVGGGAAGRLGALTTVVGTGYFAVWAVIGTAACLAGLLVAAAATRWSLVARSTPLVVAGILLFAGGLQLSPWKARQLARCRAPACGRVVGRGARGAWWHGLRVGGDCALCCAGFMLSLLVAGVMDLRIMLAVAAAITIERLAPWPTGVARACGVVVAGAGLFAVARALAAL